MRVLKSQINPRSEEFRANAQALRAAVEDLRAMAAEATLGGGEAARARHVARGKLLPRDRVERLLDPGSPFLELAQLAAYGMYDDDAPAAGDRHRHRPRRGARVHDRRERCDGEGRHLLSDDGEEAPARAGDRAAEPSAVRLPRRFRRRVPAAAGRGLSRSRAFRPHLLQPGQHVGAKGIPQIAVVMGSCTAGGAYVPAMSDETVIVEEPGHDLSRRPAAGEGGDRRGGDGGGAGRRRCAHARSPAWPITSRRTTATRWHRAPHRRQPEPPEAARRSRRRARRAALRSGGTSTA